MLALPADEAVAGGARARTSPPLAIVRDVWAAVLGVAEVGPGDDFFELGGHSFIAADAVSRLNDRLGLDLPLRAIFEAPTPAEMAALIAERDEPATAGVTPFLPDWVVPLQRQGNGRPVFVFPAGHDEARALAIDAQIAAQAGRERPFWGLRREAAALDDVRASGVPALAATYARQIWSMQPDGPVLLFGNCAGGYLAWETARSLLDGGGAVAGILFFEVPLRDDFDQLLPGVSPPHASPEWQLSRDYRPAPLPVALTHLMTDDWHERGWWRPWQQVTGGRHEVVVIPTRRIGARAFLDRRAEIIAGYVRDWVAAAVSSAPAG